jgi:oligopeptide transport system substrate-binding protein
MHDLNGQYIGRYHVLERLGEGGMATVYKAYDTRLERTIALKMIRVDIVQPAALEQMFKRFEREVKALAKMDHANIVSVYDYGEHQGAPYLVMQYLSGGTLQENVQLPVNFIDAARLLIPIGRALEYAHQHKIIHRDVKPANILITANGVPMLTDFGIAKVLESESVTQLTGIGMGVGTPDYMSPEQWAGKVVPQTDIYSLGIVFYELITGQRPFTADTPAAVAIKQATEPLMRPNIFVPGLPDEVERVLIKALAKAPQDRYETMGAFVRAMEHLLVLTHQDRTTRPAQPPTQVRVTVPPDPEVAFNTQSPPGIPNSAHAAARPGTAQVGTSAPAVAALPQVRPSHGRSSPTKRSIPTWLWIALGLLGVGVVGIVGIFMIIRLLTSPSSETIVIKETIETEVVITTTPVPVVEEETTAEKKVLVTTNGDSGDIPTLDPSLASETASLALINEMFIGLTRLHETRSVIEPGMATDWNISADGLTYTFNIRTDIPWVHYTEEGVREVTDEGGHVRYVTAHDFEYGIKRECDPEIDSGYAYVFYVIQGCSAYKDGGNPSQVAVQALDDGTLEVTFTRAAVYNSNIIGMWIGSALPQWNIDKHGGRWTEPGFSQSYGPYALKEWVHDSYAVIVKNPFWPEDMDSVPQARIDEIVFQFLDTVPAFAEYEAGGLDVAQVPIADFDRVLSDEAIIEQFFIGPSFCTYYYGFNTQNEHVNDVRVRQALSIAIDRQSLVNNVTKGGQEPAGWFSRPGLVAAPTVDSHPDIGAWYDPNTAKTLFDAYLTEKGLAAEDLDLTLMFNTSSGHQAIAEAIQQMWKDTLGVEVKLTNQEWKVFIDTVRGADTPDIWRQGWCLDYPDANNFIHDVFAAGGINNPAKPDGVGGGINWYEGADYDAWYELLLAAAVEEDTARRTDLYAEAEQILNVDKAAIIPLYWYTTSSVTKPYVDRTYSVTRLEAYEKWDIDMSAK